MIELHVTGAPVPAGRPRFSMKRGKLLVHPHPKDRVGKARIRDAWQAAGRPRVHGVYEAEVHAHVPRPPSHLTVRGELNATGRRAGLPSGDVDNFAKLALDGLVSVSAVPDDRHCVQLVVRKSWAPPAHRAGWTDVRITAVRPPATERGRTDMAVTAEAIPALTHEEAEATARIADELRREAAQLPTSSTARAWMLRCAGLLDLALERPRRPLGLPR